MINIDVWVCECVGAGVCEYGSVWVCECVSMGVYGFVSVIVCEFMELNKRSLVKGHCKLLVYF